MEKYGDSIYSDESQASQLLKNAVKGNTTSQPYADSSAEYSLKDDYASHPSPQAAISQYRIQGLAVTQTQDEFAAGKESSVHGNAPASSWEPPGLGGATSAVNTTMENANRSLGSSTIAIAGIYPDASQRVKSANNTQMPSPAPTPSPSSPRDGKRKTTRHRRQRSFSPGSDDSFAGPLPKDLQHKRYMATARAFQIPLAQLGRTQDSSSIDDVQSRDDDELSLASTDDMHVSARDNLSTTRSSRVLAPSSEPDDSQADNESFPGPQAQTIEQDDSYGQGQTQQSVWFPSSAEAEREMQKLREDNPRTQDLTQPSTPEATQTDDYIPVNDIPLQQTGTSNATSAVPTVMSMVEPWKRHRYVAAMNKGQETGHPRLNFSRPVPAPETSGFEETQPSTSSRLPATGYLLRSRSRSHSLSPAEPASNVEETQATSSANLPATGLIAPETDSSRSPTHPALESTYEETQPSTASNLPPTGERIQRELQQSRTRRPTSKTRPGMFSNLATDNSDLDIVPDSEATQPDVLRGPTLSPVIPSPNATPAQPAKPPSKPVPAPASGATPKSVSLRTPLESGPRQSVSEEVIPDSVEGEDDATEAEPDENDKQKIKPPEKEEKEEQSSEEDEQPLAKTVHRQPPAQVAAKGKRARALSQTLMPPPPKKEKVPSPVTRKTRSRAKTALPPDAEEVVPSSVPQETDQKADAMRKPARGKATTGKGAGKGKGKGKGKKAVVPKTVTPKRGRRDDLDEDESEGEDTAAEEVRTELAEDDNMSIDDTLPGPGRAGQKRKRALSMASVHCPNTRSSTKLSRVPTPGNRPMKRPKPEPLQQIKTSGATRVFALWRADNYYYCGTVMSELATDTYFVRYDDNDEEKLEIHNMRSCEFKKGDCVHSISRNCEVQIIQVPRFSAEESVTAREDDEEFELRFDDIKIFSGTIRLEWNDRKLTSDQIQPHNKLRPRSKMSSPSGQSVRSNSAGGGKLLLSKMGFAVSLSNPELRDGLSETIQSNGGMIIEDWGKIFSMSGTHEQPGQRWVLRTDEVECMESKDNLHKVFLLADKSNQKPKFLMALALGIPCVEARWLQDSVKMNERLPWQSYLLPAGNSDRLGVRVSQLVDFDWGDCIPHLHRIMHNSVAVKLFVGKKILCVSPDFVPSAGKSKKKKQGSTDDMGQDMDSKHFIPLIILCMGACVVEAVTEAKHAIGRNPVKDYDYIVIEQDKHPSVIKCVKDLANCVPFTWVKECLITGRLLPVHA